MNDRLIVVFWFTTVLKSDYANKEYFHNKN